MVEPRTPWGRWSKRHPIRLTLASWLLGEQGYRSLVAFASARGERLLVDALDAFDECTGDYPKELVEGEEWHTEAVRLRDQGSTAFARGTE